MFLIKKLIHVTVHHFRPISEIVPELEQAWAKPVMENFKIGWNVQNKNWRRMIFNTLISLMVLYMIAPNLRPKSEIFKDLER